MDAAFPDDPSHFMARTPHGHFDTDLIDRELRAAGFADISVEAIDAVSVAPSAEFAAIAFCKGTPVRNEILARDPERLDEVTARAATALAARFGQGRIEGAVRAFVITARK
jgi:hypothetical protein